MPPAASAAPDARVRSLAVADDDGERESRVKRELLRPMAKATLGGARSGGAAELEEGERVAARYRGGQREFEGRIARVNGDGTYDIHYDDGGAPRAPAAARRTGPPPTPRA